MPEPPAGFLVTISNISYQLSQRDQKVTPRRDWTTAIIFGQQQDMLKSPVCAPTAGWSYDMTIPNNCNSEDGESALSLETANGLFVVACLQFNGTSRPKDALIFSDSGIVTKPGSTTRLGLLSTKTPWYFYAKNTWAANACRMDGWTCNHVSKTDNETAIKTAFITKETTDFDDYNIGALGISITPKWNSIPLASMLRGDSMDEYVWWDLQAWHTVKRSDYVMEIEARMLGMKAEAPENFGGVYETRKRGIAHSLFKLIINPEKANLESKDNKISTMFAIDSPKRDVFLEMNGKDRLFNRNYDKIYITTTIDEIPKPPAGFLVSVVSKPCEIKQGEQESTGRWTTAIVEGK
eukprot:GHVS01060896.1.p1 GENE.GHVS01060896.1~~GHVS01060896.1.p1  ORF type:complete len:377 (-),score=32.93 GHVS01060896.1:594-1646(-)